MELTSPKYLLLAHYAVRYSLHLPLRLQKLSQNSA